MIGRFDRQRDWQRSAALDVAKASTGRRAPCLPPGVPTSAVEAPSSLGPEPGSFLGPLRLLVRAFLLQRFRRLLRVLFFWRLVTHHSLLRSARGALAIELPALLVALTDFASLLLAGRTTRTARWRRRFPWLLLLRHDRTVGEPSTVFESPRPNAIHRSGVLERARPVSVRVTPQTSWRRTQAVMYEPNRRRCFTECR
jgi:hypothetical protein